MTVTMSTDNLKTVFDACKPFVSKDLIRHPAFQGILLDFHDKKCTAYAADGIKMMQVTVPYIDGDEGSMLVPIIKLPKDPSVAISEEDDEITFTFPGGKQTFKRYPGEFLENPGKLFRAEEPTFTISFNAKNIKDALNGFTNQEYLKFDFYGPRRACTITGNDRRALVFPVYKNND